MIRIETHDPLQVLAQLPDGWAQTAITGPPAGDKRAGMFGVLAVVGQLRRVTRPDATLLWDIERPVPCSLRSLAVCFALVGWQLQRSALASSSGFLLFAKQPRFFWQLASAGGLPRSGRAVCGTDGPLRCARRPWCIPAGSTRTAGRVQRLMLAGSAPAACGACGTPRPATRGDDPQRRSLTLAACGHINPHGRCLVIDPFQQPGSPLADLAVRHGRAYLGIQNPTTDEAAGR